MASQVLIPARCQQTGKFMQLVFTQTGQMAWNLVDCILTQEQPQQGWKSWLHRSTPPAQPLLVHIRGTLLIDPVYPNCVHCEAVNRYSREIARCEACGNICCWATVQQQGICPTCRIIITLNGQPLGNLRGVMAPVPQQPPPLIAAHSVVIQEVPAGSQLLLPEPGERRW